MIENELNTLDEVLTYFRSSRGNEGATFEELLNDFEAKEYKINFEQQLKYIIEKLLRDNLIYIKSKEDLDNIRYTVTLEGKIFEGYYYERLNQENHVIDKRAQEDRMEGLSLKLNRWTKRAAYGAMGLVVVEILTHWKDLLELFFCR